MGRLIDADALKAQLQREIDIYFDENGGGIHTAMEARDEVDNAPTVDAVPVRHGKWIDEGYYADNSNYKAWHCSKCNWHMLAYDDELFSYCPMCGARMDGSENDKTD